MLESGRGKVRLIKRSELPDHWNIGKVKSVWAMVQGLCHAMDTGGKEKAAALMAEISRSNPGNIENIKALAYRAYMIAERKCWTEEALAYNSLVSLWSDLTSAMNEINKRVPKPQDLEF
jgi:putative DNA methylase